MHFLTKGVPEERDTLLVISNLQQGGAERQLCMLANGLARRGMGVVVLVFSVRCREKDLFYKALLHESVELTVVGGTLRLGRGIGVVREIIGRRPYAVIAFLPIPSLICEFTRLIGRHFTLLVSERSWNPNKRFELVRYWFHCLADAVVSNSYAQQERIRSINSAVAAKTVVIRNAIDLETFKPAVQKVGREGGRLRVLVLARIVEEKNPIGLLQALYEVGRRTELDVRVDWYGALSSSGWRLFAPNRKAYGERLLGHIGDLGMAERFRLHSPRSDVTSLYRNCDVVCLPSFAEGCSNFICEAMACGIPVLASDIADNGRLVRHGYNGFLFDPRSISEMVAAITRFAELPPLRREYMGLASRERAATMLNPDAYVDEYERLLKSFVSRDRG